MLPFCWLTYALGTEFTYFQISKQCIRCNKKIRIKIFVLWFHGRCHIEQIDVRLLSKTQNRNDVSTWNLVQMLRRHRYTTLFSWNFKFLFEIWITVKSNMIGRFTVTMATNSKLWRHDLCVMLLSTFVPSMTSIGCLTFKLEMFQYLANQKHCYVTIATNV